jgi:hypothetical protein
MIDTVDQSSVQFPKASYRITDNFSTAVQGNIFYGNDDTTFGDYYENTGALTSLQLEF